MRLPRLALALAAFLITLEVVLQIGAFVAAIALDRPAQPGRAGVLCLGDSYTYGIGATSPEASYPGQLRARLHERGCDVQVGNGGSPGQDSAFLLRTLPGLLRPETRVLCVMLGTNDSWSRPAPVSTEELARSGARPQGFEWRWRTGRLLALGWRFAANAWRRTGDRGADDPVSPAPDARVRQDLVDLDAGFALLTAIEVLPAAAVLPVLPPPCPGSVQPQLDEVFRLLDGGEPAAARDRAIAVAAAHPDSPHALHALVLAAERSGDAELARATLGRLAERAASGDPLAEETWVLTLHAVGRTAEALAAARARVAHEPAAVLAWNVLQHASYVLGDWQEFERGAAATLALAGRLRPHESALIARNYAQALSSRDKRKAASLLVAATLLDGDVGLTRAKMQKVREALPWSEFATVLAAVRTTRPATQAALRNVLQAVYAGEDSHAWEQVLRDHLLAMGHLAAARGVRVVVLSYPFFQPDVEAVQREVAQALGAPFVPVRERFDRELRTRDRGELFARDGHCNDAGYAIVAEMAAAAVLPLLTQ